MYIMDIRTMNPGKQMTEECSFGYHLSYHLNVAIELNRKDVFIHRIIDQYNYGWGFQMWLLHTFKVCETFKYRSRLYY